MVDLGIDCMRKQTSVVTLNPSKKTAFAKVDSAKTEMVHQLKVLLSPPRIAIFKLYSNPFLNLRWSSS